MEYFYFPKDNYCLTQGYGKNSYSHKNRKALDVSAKGGNKNIYAPFTGYYAKKYISLTSAYTVWLVSKEKIMCADGIKHYVVCMFTHPKEIKNINVGQTFNQNDLIMTDGDTGQATGKHLDLEVAVYDNQKDIKADWKNNNGEYGLINSVDPCKYMLLKEDSKIINETYLGKKYHFEKQIKIKYSTGIYKLLFSKAIRTSPEIKNNIVKVKQCTKETKKYLTNINSNDNALIKKNTQITISKIVYDEEGRIWGQYGNCYIVLCNKKGIAQAKKYV